MNNRSLEIIFVVEEAPEGGVVARAQGHDVFTEADDLSVLRDAVRGHFDDAQRQAHPASLPA